MELLLSGASTREQTQDISRLIHRWHMLDTDKCRKYELVHHLKAADVRFVIVEPDLLPQLAPAAKEAGIPRGNILLFDNNGEQLKDGFKSWWTLFEHGEHNWEKFNDLQTAKNTTLARLFSSGTTGMSWKSIGNGVR